MSQKKKYAENFTVTTTCVKLITSSRKKELERDDSEYKCQSTKQREIKLSKMLIKKTKISKQNQLRLT